VLSLAIQLEETGVGAYNGAAPLIQSPDLLNAAGSIVQVEGRHAGALRELAGKDPAPAAFDRSLSKADVLKAVKPFVKGGP
jgi:rubrerythrin